MSPETAPLSAITSWGGWVAAIVIAAFSLIPKLRKADVADADVALTAWRELADRLSGENRTLQETNATFRQQVSALEQALDSERASRRQIEDDLSDMKRRHNDEMAAMRTLYDEQIAGLKSDLASVHAQIVQNSRSTVQLIPKTERPGT